VPSSPLCFTNSIYCQEPEEGGEGREGFEWLTERVTEWACDLARRRRKKRRRIASNFSEDGEGSRAGKRKEAN
jgi:hypothetical protein